MWRKPWKHHTNVLYTFPPTDPYNWLHAQLTLCGHSLRSASHADMIDAGDFGQRRRLIETIALIGENDLNGVNAF